jgi:uncharacterized protein (TIGR02145 family)
LTNLTNFLGGISIAGGKMKEEGTAHWNSPNTGATNISGFTALPGGYRRFSDFLDINTNGYWWSSTLDALNSPTGWAWSIDLRSNTNSVYRSEINRTYNGLSVRLVKD